MRQRRKILKASRYIYQMQISITACAIVNAECNECRVLLPPRSWVHLEVSVKSCLASGRPLAYLFSSYTACEAPCDFLVFSYSDSLLLSGGRRKRVAYHFLRRHLIDMLSVTQDHLTYRIFFP